MVKNRRALFDHELLKKFTAGIVLKGAEVKAIREKRANFEGSYVQLYRGKPVVLNMYIGPYSKQGKNFNEQDARRTRQLLLNKSEIEELRRELQQKGHIGVPIALLLVNNLVKIEFGVMRSKKDFQKKDAIKERQMDRDMLIETKDFKRLFWN